MAWDLTRVGRRVLEALVTLGRADLGEIVYEAECSKCTARELLVNYRHYRQWVARCSVNGPNGAHRYVITAKGLERLGLSTDGVLDP